MCSLSPSTQPFFSAKRWSMAVGSAPVDRMKMMGVLHEVSGNTSSSVQGGGSVNSAPSLLATYWLHANTSFSSLNTRMMHSLPKWVPTFSSHPAGRGSVWGSSAVAHASHSAVLLDTLSARPWSAGMACSAYCSAAQALGLIHAAGGATVLCTTPVGPRTRKLHSGPLMSGPLDSSLRMEVHTRKLNKLLCSSNRPLLTLLKMKRVTKSDSSCSRVGTSSALSLFSMQ
mmetsp:Transcript_34220/g.75909  ORF Transcript_34220/g.75909 Transcript_34220/m.75909 type:complete len:228 (-) Transcript_34220:276-959(-)